MQQLSKCTSIEYNVYLQCCNSNLIRSVAGTGRQSKGSTSPVSKVADRISYLSGRSTRPTSRRLHRASDELLDRVPVMLESSLAALFLAFGLRFLTMRSWSPQGPSLNNCCAFLGTSMPDLPPLTFPFATGLTFCSVRRKLRIAWERIADWISAWCRGEFVRLTNWNIFVVSRSWVDFMSDLYGMSGKCALSTLTAISIGDSQQCARPRSGRTRTHWLWLGIFVPNSAFA